MRTLWIVAVLILCSVPAAAQQTRWEYGRLSVLDVAGIPTPIRWSAGDSSVNAKALLTAGAPAKTDMVIGVLNELDRQGWEFLQASPGLGLIFRRARQP